MAEDLRARYEHPDMTPTVVHRLVAWTLTVATALALLAVPVWREMVGDVDSLGKVVAGIDLETSSAQTMRHALLAAIDRFENRLEATSPILQTALPTLQWAFLRFGGIGNETVYAGPRRGGERGLVLRTGFDHLVGAPLLDPDVLDRRRRAQSSWQPAIEPDPRPALLDFHRQLAARGIELILLPVPTKVAVHPEMLASTVDEPLRNPLRNTLRNPSLNELLAALREAGIQVLDPAEVLRSVAEKEPAYLRTDSHWSPAAVDAVAEALASRIEQVVTLSPADLSWTRTRFERRGRGDLWRLLKLPAGRPLYAEEVVVVDEVTSWDGRLWSPKHGANVLLLGDSFTTVYSDPALHWGSAAGLAEQLAYHLGRHVDRIARPDGSSDQVRRDLARRPERLTEAKVVVYQVATRELSLGDWPQIEIE